jgi:hypothetical protein
MLADLDELVLKCRDERARAYIREAVTCCKAGAYRSAIVSTWIAVAFDIIDKIHELSLTGDKAALAFVEEFERAMANDNPTQSLVIERELLKNARDKFELISQQEFVDLDRLQTDRHRCAHPSRSSFSEVFTPSAELARTHIRSAVECLLQHEPAQGKAALNVLMRDIFSEYFPVKHADALAFLQRGPLKRARPSLVRNLLLVLVKSTLNTETKGPQIRRNRQAISCMLKMHMTICAETLQGELSRLFRNLTTDDQIERGVTVLTIDPLVAEALEQDQILKLQGFASKMPNGHLDLLPVMLQIPSLEQSAKRRIASLSAKEIREAWPLFLPDPVRARVISGYSKAHSFDIANDWARVVSRVADEFTAQETQALLTALAGNQQVKGSFGIAGVLDAFAQAEVIPADELQKHRLAILGLPETDPADPAPGFSDDIPF